MLFRIHCYHLLICHCLPNISPLIIDNNVVELVESTKFLGVYIDQHLTWKTHINVISKKIAKSIGLIYKANFYLHQNSISSFIILRSNLSLSHIL